MTFWCWCQCMTLSSSLLKTMYKCNVLKAMTLYDFCKTYRLYSFTFTSRSLLHLELIAYVFPCFSHCQLDLHFFQKQRKNDAVKKAKVIGKSELHCPKCDKVFALASKLRFHMKSHKAERALLRKTLKMPIQSEVPAYTMHNFDLDM